MSGRAQLVEQLVIERYSRPTSAWFTRPAPWLDDSEEATERRRRHMAEDFDRIDQSTRATRNRKQRRKRT